jgi:hypothetical protein
MAVAGIGEVAVESVVAKAIKAPLEPVALLFSNDLPDGAVQFGEGKWGCVMWLLVAAAKGQAAAASWQSFGCLGGGTGLGFGNQYDNWPGGIDCFYHFLSTGNDPQQGAAAMRAMVGVRRSASSDWVHGERYLKTPDAVRKFVNALPIIEIPTRYVVLKPISQVRSDERPEVVVFLVDPDRLSALVVLANYGRDTSDNVVIPWGAGCQTIGIFAYREARASQPRAVVGLTDLSARKYVAKQLGHDLMTFTVPLALFEEMEANVPDSFLERETWLALLADGR